MIGSLMKGMTLFIFTSMTILNSSLVFSRMRLMFLNWKPSKSWQKGFTSLCMTRPFKLGAWQYSRNTRTPPDLSTRCISALATVQSVAELKTNVWTSMSTEFDCIARMSSALDKMKLETCICKSGLCLNDSLKKHTNSQKYKLIENNK
jgi:hypothetical protein